MATHKIVVFHADGTMAHITLEDASNRTAVAMADTYALMDGVIGVDLITL